MLQYGIFVKNGDGGINHLTTFILHLRKIMPHYGIFFMIGDVGLKLSDNSTLPLREFMSHYGIFVLIVVAGHKLSDHFFSASLRNYAPLWYICKDWGWWL